MRTYDGEAQGPRRTLVLADDAGRPLAQLVTKHTRPYAFTVYWPQFLGDFAADVRREIGELLLRECLLRAHADGEVRYLESLPADDVDDHELWREVLVAHGVDEIACAHAHVLALPATLAPSDGSIDVVDAADLEEATFAQLYERARHGTLDRSDAQDRRSTAETLHALRTHSMLEVHAPWLVARVDGRDAGVVLCGIEPIASDGARVAWILEIAVLPEMRARGVGRALLAQAIRTLGERGATYVHAQIDDVNVPSLALHARLGFRPLPYRFFTHRRTIR